jgi:hypothetical protein
VLAQFVDCFAYVASVLALLDRDHTQSSVRELVGSGKVGDSVKQVKHSINTKFYCKSKKKLKFCACDGKSLTEKI